MASLLWISFDFYSCLLLHLVPSVLRNREDLNLFLVRDFRGDSALDETTLALFHIIYMIHGYEDYDQIFSHGNVLHRSWAKKLQRLAELLRLRHSQHQKRANKHHIHQLAFRTQNIPQKCKSHSLEGSSSSSFDSI